MRRCECGADLDYVQTKCHICGKTFAVDPLIGGYVAPEPPLKKWTSEADSRRSYSDQSMREVKKEFEQRQKNLASSSHTFESKSQNSTGSRKPLIVALVLAGLAIGFAFANNGNSAPIEVVNPIPAVSSFQTSAVDSGLDLFNNEPAYGEVFEGGGGQWHYTRIYVPSLASLPCSSENQIDWNCSDQSGLDSLNYALGSCQISKFQQGEEIYDGSGTLIAKSVPLDLRLMDLKVQNKNVNLGYAGETAVGCVVHYSADILRKIDTPINVELPPFATSSTLFPIGGLVQGSVTLYPFNWVSDSGFSDAPPEVAELIKTYFPHPALR